MQWCLSTDVLSIDIGSVVDQELHIHKFSLQDGEVERGGPIGISSIDFIAKLVSQDQNGDVALVRLCCTVHHAELLKGEHVQICIEVL